jgi:hypothetical protein
MIGGLILGIILRVQVPMLAQRRLVPQADGSGNNVWQPGAFGWVEVT